MMSAEKDRLLPLILSRTRKLDDAERLRLCQEALQVEEENPFDVKELEAEKTTYFRDKVWKRWLQYTDDMALNNLQHWMDFCLDKEDAMKHCRAFLSVYVEQSYVERPCLEAEEWRSVRTLNSAVCIRDIWIALLRRADEHVLQAKRSECGEGIWRACLSSRSPEYRNSPGATMVKWISLYCEKKGLSTTQSFIKRELPEEDAVLALSVLWMRGEHIRCMPGTRLAFHSAFLLAAIGGFRPASLMKFPYKNVRFFWHQNPARPGQTSLTAEIKVEHVKQQKHRLEQHQRSYLIFYVGFAECKQICLLSCLAARALHDNAFDAGFTTMDELLRGPAEQGIETVPLKWKQDMRDKAIVPITYTTYWTIWNRTLYVAGIRNEDKLRPYSLRVTAGKNLDGSLTRAAANFIMSHGTNVFERSYQTPHVSTDLMRIAFGARAGDNGNTFSRLSSVFSRRDPYSPLYLTTEELAGFEKRQDITCLRRAHKQALEDKEQTLAGELKYRTKYIIDYLEKLTLTKKRDEYFAQVDDLRARGLSTSHLRQDTANPRRKRGMLGCENSAIMGHLFENNVSNSKLVAYLVNYLKDQISKDDLSTRRQNEQKPKRTMCILCDKSFATKRTLSRHVAEGHDFSQAFHCPACLKSGHTVLIGADSVLWSVHVESVHGKEFAPVPNKKLAYCLLCSTEYTARGFGLHFSKAHEPFLQFPLRCTECERKGVIVDVQNRKTWIQHAVKTHGSTDQAYGSVLCPVTHVESASKVEDVRSVNDTTTKRKLERFDTEQPELRKYLDDTECVKRRKREESSSDNDLEESTAFLRGHSPVDKEFWVTGRDPDYPELDEVEELGCYYYA